MNGTVSGFFLSSAHNTTMPQRMNRFLRVFSYSHSLTNTMRALTQHLYSIFMIANFISVPTNWTCIHLAHLTPSLTLALLVCRMGQHLLRFLGFYLTLQLTRSIFCIFRFVSFRFVFFFGCIIIHNLKCT